MTDWQEHWDTFPLTVGETEFLRQVGKTVQGQPISDAQFRRIVSDISERLELEASDVVLDLCCGNGLITQEIAKTSRMVVGVDSSEPLINIARKHHQPRNVHYLHTSVLDLAPALARHSEPFTKVYMYEALQHFRKDDLLTILTTIMEVTTTEARILFGSVPDRDRLWAFYNTPKRRLTYLKGRMQGRDAIGTWWDKHSISSTCRRLGLQCVFFEQHSLLHTSHYRFDVCIARDSHGECQLPQQLHPSSQLMTGESACSNES